MKLTTRKPTKKKKFLPSNALAGQPKEKLESHFVWLFFAFLLRCNNFSGISYIRKQYKNPVHNFTRDKFSGIPRSNNTK